LEILQNNSTLDACTAEAYQTGLSCQQNKTNEAISQLYHQNEGRHSFQAIGQLTIFFLKVLTSMHIALGFKGFMYVP
jgi:hypothetical protein